MKPVFVIVAIFMFITPISIVFADDAKPNYVLMESVPFIGAVNTSVPLPAYLTGLYKFAIGTVGIAALLMLTVGGFWYMTSAGNQARAGNAKKIITDALLGLIMVFFTWLLLNTLNPDLLQFDLRVPEALKIDTDPPGAGPENTVVTGPIPTDVKDLPKGCENYLKDFKSAAGGDPTLGCLLYGIASQESRCNPNAQSAYACGIMQFRPSTGARYGLPTCDALKQNPLGSIAAAVKYLNDSKATLATYTQLPIGAHNTQSGTKITIGPFTYDTGNDDLIASYNAGFGTTSGSKIGPFAVSKSCREKDGIIPVWQCDIKTDGFLETRKYVQHVQGYQKLCEDNNLLK